jgi:hypothetical protein
MEVVGSLKFEVGVWINEWLVDKYVQMLIELSHCQIL